MIGLIATILTGIMLKNYVFLLIMLAYLLRLRSRNASLAAFYLYVLLMAVSLPGISIYTWKGLRLAGFVALSTVLALDDVLRGIRVEGEEIILSAVLIVSAVTDYTFLIVLIAVVLYSSYRHFGKATAYLAGWLGLSAAVMYLTRDSLADPVAQAFVIIGLGLLFILFAERKDVEFLEARLFGREMMGSSFFRRFSLPSSLRFTEVYPLLSQPNLIRNGCIQALTLLYVWKKGF